MTGKTDGTGGSEKPTSTFKLKPEEAVEISSELKRAFDKLEFDGYNPQAITHVFFRVSAREMMRDGVPENVLLRHIRDMKVD